MHLMALSEPFRFGPPPSAKKGGLICSETCGDESTAKLIEFCISLGNVL